MLDDFDQIIGQAKRIVNTSQAIASEAFPNGALLTCSRCDFTMAATKSDCARFFSLGWPKHHGAAMTAARPSSPLDATNG